VTELVISDEELRAIAAPLGPERTVEQMLVRELRNSILDGRLRPGVRLPYRELARQFTVSVTPVRIALRELSSEGLVEMRPHGGATVAPLSIDELEELFAIRTGVEPWLARLGAERVTAPDMEAMSAHMAEMEAGAAARDRRHYLEAAWAYRSTCYGAAGRPRLLQTASLLFRRSTRYMYLSIADEYRFEQSLASSRRLAEACRARDGRAAGQVVRESLEWSLEFLSQSLRESLAD
jgi:DNA-binding GntR family transcriptional regulator